MAELDTRQKGRDPHYKGEQKELHKRAIRRVALATGLTVAEHDALTGALAARDQDARGGAKEVEKAPGELVG